jgi:hypothetical protein
MDLVWLGLYVGLILACVVIMAAWPALRGEAMVGLIVTLALMPIGLRRASGESAPVDDRLDRLANAIESATREGGLSEAAKRVLHRREERELLRREIQRDIQDGDFDAAMVLVKELAERFGYRADAEEFRGRIERSRAETTERQVSVSIDGLNRLILERRWTDAFAEAARLIRLHPDNHRVDNLRQRVEESRQRYKLDLERRFLQAANREQIDEAMSLLKELDQYLLETEAEQFREVARGVIGKARENLGARFKLAIQDRNWRAAVDFGERIIIEFPNTRMAEEVRNMIDTLRTKAAPGAAAGV